MEDLSLPSVGTSFKKWVCCTPILPKTLAHFLNFPIIFLRKKIKMKQFAQGQVSTRDWRVTANRWPVVAECLNLNPCKFFLISPAFLFFCMRSTPPGWLQHMPALPRVHRKTSNTYKF
jgi:hypothetical protein